MAHIVLVSTVLYFVLQKKNKMSGSRLLIKGTFLLAKNNHMGIDLGLI
jgi:hypothetical protein